MAITEAQRDNPNLPRPVKIAEKRIPFATILRDVNIRDAGDKLVEFAQQFAEKEFFERATVTIKVREPGDSWSSATQFYAVVTRDETEDEIAERIVRTQKRREQQRKAKLKREREEAERELKRTQNKLKHLQQEMKKFAEQEQQLKSKLKRA